MMFKKMENITNFIRASRTLGVLEKDVFNTVCRHYLEEVSRLPFL